MVKKGCGLLFCEGLRDVKLQRLTAEDAEVFAEDAEDFAEGAELFIDTCANTFMWIVCKGFHCLAVIHRIYRAGRYCSRKE
jgi:hypothetical protein